jgi:hypothetical protein
VAVNEVGMTVTTMTSGGKNLRKSTDHRRRKQETTQKQETKASVETGNTRQK